VIVMVGTTIGLVDKVFESVNGSVGIASYTKVKKNELRYKMLYLVYYLTYCISPLHYNTSTLKTLTNQAPSKCRNNITSYYNCSSLSNELIEFWSRSGFF